jgi:type IV pilus assembly protein PilX
MRSEGSSVVRRPWRDARRGWEHAAPRGGQRGVVLFIALIVIVAMMLAGAGLMRSVDTGTVIAGNFAFKQATIQAVDAGIEAAYNATFARVASAATGSTAGSQYYPTLQSLGADGVPAGIDWSAAPMLDLATTNGNRVQYVVERMCWMPGGAVPSTDQEVVANCVTEPADTPPCVRAPCAPWTTTQKVNYRVTLRVTGPRNTVTTAQSVIAF